MKGAGAKDARFEAPEAPIGLSVGRGCPVPTEEEAVPLEVDLV